MLPDKYIDFNQIPSTDQHTRLIHFSNIIVIFFIRKRGYHLDRLTEYKRRGSRGSGKTEKNQSDLRNGFIFILLFYFSLLFFFVVFKKMWKRILGNKRHYSLCVRPFGRPFPRQLFISNLLKLKMMTRLI